MNIIASSPKKDNFEPKSKKIRHSILYLPDLSSKKFFLNNNPFRKSRNCYKPIDKTTFNTYKEKINIKKEKKQLRLSEGKWDSHFHLMWSKDNHLVPIDKRELFEHPLLYNIDGTKKLFNLGRPHGRITEATCIIHFFQNYSKLKQCGSVMI